MWETKHNVDSLNSQDCRQLTESGSCGAFLADIGGPFREARETQVSSTK